MKSSLPKNFEGVPFVNNLKATFYWNEHIDTDIQPLWNLFEAALTHDQKYFSESFDTVVKQRGIKWNITMGLYWIRPYDYISLDSANRNYLPSIGVEVFNESEINYNNYNILLSKVANKLKNNEISEHSIPEISVNAWKKRSVWLVGYSVGSESLYETFIKESLWQGEFSDGNKSDQELLKETKKIQKGDILILKSTSTKGSNHNQPFLRVKGVGIITSDIKIQNSEKKTLCSFSVKYLDTTVKDFDGATYGSYRKIIHQLDSNHIELLDYINSILGKENMQISKYDKYIKLLKANKNLVLTGFPGTGKTYMAKSIAKDMDAEIKFVQFHPSYDYTDFVEGLRPIQNETTGQIGFERKDGVFKEFCKKAVRNLIDSQKNAETLGKEQNWQDKLMQFVNDAIENNTSYRLTNKGQFTITEINDSTIIVNNEENLKTASISLSIDEILDLLTNEVPLSIVRDIRDYYNRAFGTQADSYVFVIVNEIRKIKRKVVADSVNYIKRKDYVFIIDEINRGEASKIFGELFYAIDPGYRGDKDIRIQTQYQNLVPSSDIFANGFYVPENVYILATMNDIDRSVESMDFAMRRRFTWIEISPSDTQDMLDRELNEDISSKAKEKMICLNCTISQTEGLGDAYMIGPSYFLKLDENGGDFDSLWSMNLEPLLKEYLRGFRNSKEIMVTFEKAYFEGKKEDNSNLEKVIDED